MTKCSTPLIAFLWMLPLAGQNLRSWVSSAGWDSNSCTRTSPCATFQGALAKTNGGGKIDVVDPNDYAVGHESGRTAASVWLFEVCPE